LDVLLELKMLEWDVECMCHVMNHVDKGAINPACPKICCLYAVAERQNITQQNTDRHRERRRKRKRKRDGSNFQPVFIFSFSVHYASFFPFPLLRYPFPHSHSNPIFLPRFTKKRERKRKQNKGLLPFLHSTSTSLQFFLYPSFSFNSFSFSIYYFHFGIQFFDYCYSSIQLSIGSRHPPLLLLSYPSELSISEFYWPLIELGICKICGFNCWAQKVSILVVDQPNYRFGSDRGRNSAIRWRCSEGSSTGSRRIGFWRFPREFMVCFLPISLVFTFPLVFTFSILCFFLDCSVFSA